MKVRCIDMCRNVRTILDEHSTISLRALYLLLGLSRCVSCLHCHAVQSCPPASKARIYNTNTEHSTDQF